MPFVVLLVLAPVFRYSYWRDAWILRAIGEKRGPVLVRRSRRTGHTGLESRLARTPPLPALVVLGALVTVAVGFVLARTVGGGSGRLERTAYSPSGLFQVSVPRGWRAQAKPTGGPRGITDEISLQPEGAVDGVLILGRFGTNEPDAARRSLLGSAAGAARPQTVTLAGAQFTRYVAAPSSASRYVARSVSVLPTSLGMIVALCLTDVSGPAFTANCERVLASVKLSSRALGHSLPPSYAAQPRVGAQRPQRRSNRRCVRTRGGPRRNSSGKRGRVAGASSLHCGGPTSWALGWSERLRPAPRSSQP